MGSGFLFRTKRPAEGIMNNGESWTWVPPMPSEHAMPTKSKGMPTSSEQRLCNDRPTRATSPHAPTRHD